MVSWGPLEAEGCGDQPWQFVVEQQLQIRCVGGSGSVGTLSGSVPRDHIYGRHYQRRPGCDLHQEPGASLDEGDLYSLEVLAGLIDLAGAVSAFEKIVSSSFSCLWSFLVGGGTS